MNEKVERSKALFAQNKDKINAAIRQVCDRSFGVLNNEFLCQSIGILEPKRPICLAESASIGDALKHLREHKIGCVLIVDAKGKLSGILTERDVILKLLGIDQSKPVSEYMTKDPVCEHLDTSIAFALNLMSQGGFRHIPLIDQDRIPVGIVSVKDVLDHIVASFISDVLNFEVPVHTV